MAIVVIVLPRSVVVFPPARSLAKVCPLPLSPPTKSTTYGGISARMALYLCRCLRLVEPACAGASDQHAMGAAGLGPSLKMLPSSV